MPRTTWGGLFFGTILRSPMDPRELTDPQCHSEPKPAGPRESYKSKRVTHNCTHETAGVENEAFDRSPEMSVPGSRSEGADAPPRAVTGLGVSTERLKRCTRKVFMDPPRLGAPRLGDSEETQVYKVPLSPGDQTPH